MSILLTCLVAGLKGAVAPNVLTSFLGVSAPSESWNLRETLYSSFRPNDVNCQLQPATGMRGHGIEPQLQWIAIGRRFPTRCMLKSIQRSGNETELKRDLRPQDSLRAADSLANAPAWVQLVESDVENGVKC